MLVSRSGQATPLAPEPKAYALTRATLPTAGGSRSTSPTRSPSSRDVWVLDVGRARVVAPHDQRHQRQAHLDPGRAAGGVLEQRRPVVGRGRRERPPREPARVRGEPLRRERHARRPHGRVPGNGQLLERHPHARVRFGAGQPDHHPRGLRRVRPGALARRPLAGVPVRPDRADGGVRPGLPGARRPGSGVAPGRHRAGVGPQRPGAVLSLGGQSDGRLGDAVARRSRSTGAVACSAARSSAAAASASTTWRRTTSTSS